MNDLINAYVTKYPDTIKIEVLEAGIHPSLEKLLNIAKHKFATQPETVSSKKPIETLKSLFELLSSNPQSNQISDQLISKNKIGELHELLFEVFEKRDAQAINNQIKAYKKASSSTPMTVDQSLFNIFERNLSTLTADERKNVLFDNKPICDCCSNCFLMSSVSGESVKECLISGGAAKAILCNHFASNETDEGL
ncbi:hypothetical protein [Pseudoalteromonas sp. bablab_jr004]|uniref:hypothetical protein n=1 Tax=Pseudoalteromonas sp. bablab_jr004 TaxID=2755065 RepID=UPI0018F7BB78|nr:hypothetical protein [Pseudoalteromonas sp. bablab_jr004]